ncbi:MAG: response regulator transcription factor [Bacteroidales bacterium]|nr:response regulator transcription factor [Bacteroidales bacterium]
MEKKEFVINKFYQPIGITERDYQQAQLFIDAAQAFAQTSYQTIYIVDYFRNDFLFVSDNPIFSCGYSVEQIKAEGYAFFVHNTVEAEFFLLSEIQEASLSAFNHIPLIEKKKCMVSYDFHLITNQRKLLVNHKLSPLAFDASGRMWLALCVASFSAHREIGHIQFYRLLTQKFSEYSLLEHNWIELKEITLKPEEKEMLVLSSRGFSVSEIAERMYKSQDTVKLYRKQLFDKLDARNIIEALSYAVNYGLL